MSEASNVQPLEAPLTLTAPTAVATVTQTKAPEMVPLDEKALPGLDKLVTDYAETLTTTDPHSPEFSAKTNQVRTMGDADVKTASAFSNRLLEKSVHQMSKNSDTTGDIPQTLLDLRRTIESLDPSEATGVKKFLGIVPFGDKVQDYFRKYESNQKHLDTIIQSLYRGQDELRRDNADLEQEKVNLWAAMQRLKQYIYVAEKLDQVISEKVTELKVSDPERAKILEQDVLFYVRQKHQDLLTQLAVSIQGYLAIDVIRKNNLELIKGVDRASTTTIAALRTAVIVAQALTNQKLVLDQVNALNSTTTNLIESTSKLLATQSADIQQQAASSTIGIEALQAAFANIYTTMDELDNFKSASLQSMSATIETLNIEVAKSQEYLKRANRSTPELTLPENDENVEPTFGEDGTGSLTITSKP